MRKIIFTLTSVILTLNLFAQTKLEISDIIMTNLGDKQMYATKNDADKTPLDGKNRIITGFTTEYIDAEFKNGYGVGKWEYYKENKLTVTVNFKDGYMEGEYSELYKSGDLKEKGQYVKGQKNGTWETYKSDGIIKLTEIFDNGSLTKKITYYTDGSVDTERNFKNGKEDGIIKQYTWEGELKSEKNYVNGKQVGKQMQHYSSNTGNFIQTSNYNENGMLDGEFQEVFVENNAIKTKGKYEKGRKVGKWVYGYAHQLYKEETYENGKLVETTKLNE
jgi:antitoxin component YwqK of YwqJK toxin-antitoxin module